MQFNMYHHYTVDEHTIQCISVLNQIEQQELTEDLPLASDILEKGVNRKVLYMALLLHDIGNSDFATHVRTKTHLNLLTVLTVCDIRGVGPDRWNNWKAVLIRQLHTLTLEHLNEGSEAVSKSRQERIGEAQALFSKRARHVTGDSLQEELSRHYAGFWLGTDIKAQLVMSKLSREVDFGDILSDIQMDKSRDATRACFSMIDHPGIFSRLTGALAIAGANIVDARTYTTRDGVATSVFWLQDAARQPYEKSRLGRLRKVIAEILGGEKVAREVLKEKYKPKKRERPFEVPTNISIDNEGSEIFTIIEVDTRDRPGLLHDLSRTIASSNLTISSAIIATYGNQVVDTFYVKDLYGHKIHAKRKQDVIEAKLREAIKISQKPSAELVK